MSRIDFTIPSTGGAWQGTFSRPSKAAKKEKDRRKISRPSKAVKKETDKPPLDNMARDAGTSFASLLFYGLPRQGRDRHGRRIVVSAHFSGIIGLTKPLIRTPIWQFAALMPEFHSPFPPLRQHPEMGFLLRSLPRQQQQHLKRLRPLNQRKCRSPLPLQHQPSQRKSQHGHKPTMRLS